MERAPTPERADAGVDNANGRRLMNMAPKNMRTVGGLKQLYSRQRRSLPEPLRIRRLAPRLSAPAHVLPSKVTERPVHDFTACLYVGKYA